VALHFQFFYVASQSNNQLTKGFTLIISWVNASIKVIRKYVRPNCSEWVAALKMRYSNPIMVLNLLKSSLRWYSFAIVIAFLNLKNLAILLGSWRIIVTV
jgi:hypothetical protein